MPQSIRLREHDVVVTHAAGEDVQEVARDGRRRIDECPEPLAIDRQERGRLDRDDIGRDAGAIDYGKLADAFAGAEPDVWALSGADLHVNRSGNDEEQRVIFLAGAKERLAGTEGAARAAVQDRIDERPGDLGKQPG